MRRIGHIAAWHCDSRMGAVQAVQAVTAAIDRKRAGNQPDRSHRVAAPWKFDDVPMEVKGDASIKARLIVAHRAEDHVCAFYGDPMPFPTTSGGGGGGIVPLADRRRPRGAAELALVG